MLVLLKVPVERSTTSVTPKDPGYRSIALSEEYTRTSHGMSTVGNKSLHTFLALNKVSGDRLQIHIDRSVASILQRDR
jgi:hypothetical protein